MFSEHSTFGKVVIIVGSFLAVAVFGIAVVASLASLAQVIEGRTFGAIPLKVMDYIMSVLLIVWVWFCFVAHVALIRLLCNFGNLKKCRILAGCVCLMIPFGTLFGVLVFIYLGRRKEWSQS
ncbi:MAG TPA: hypothetical protein VK968_00695 [Roseimicrobium sp.]|nr:hypothetical protein [Roseimicrobium sp.]